jgi:hypothetical protein
MQMEIEIQRQRVADGGRKGDREVVADVFIM